jgi:hypothetical protein
MITSTKKTEDCGYVGRVMFRVFWNLKSMLLSEFMPPGTAVKYEWCETMGKLQA